MADAAAQPRRIQALRIDQPILCDAADKDIWRRARAQSDFTEPWAAPRGPIVCSVRVLWTNACLYVRFDSSGAELAATRTARHSDVCCDSCVEMFISPFRTAPERYFTFEINALGTMLNRKMDLSADPVLREPWCPAGMRIGHSVTGTQVDDPASRAWCVELAVPFDAFRWGAETFRPTPGAVWRVNFMRCGGRRLNPFLMWSPAQSPKPAYHQPKFFGELEFL
ncbi:MAG: carbohydrate-binding family 9-like protein [Planctomycetota bacterium]